MAAKKGGAGDAAGEHDFPVLFTIDNTNRHEIIVINPGFDISDLKDAMSSKLKSPNCAEVLSKYRNKDSKDEVSEVKVKWGEKPIRCETSLTDDNVEAVLRMMAQGGGKDVFNVSVKSKSTGEGGKSTGEGGKPTGEEGKSTGEGDKPAPDAPKK